MGHSRGGFSTKIHAIVDAKGRPLHVTLTAGERHEMVAARELLGLKPVIHSKPERPRAYPLDRKLYRIRYLVEVCFHELKRFRAIGTRYDKTKTSFLALLQVACICLWLN